MAGFLLAVAGTVVLIVLSAMQQKWIHLVSFSIYGATMIFVFLFSSILHSFMIFGKYFKVFGILDHSAIYLLIAGTYTPFCLALIGGALGWTIFGIIWGLAIVNLVLKAVFFENMDKAFSMAGYLVMGWISILMAYQLICKWLGCPAYNSFWRLVLHYWRHGVLIQQAEPFSTCVWKP